MIAVPGGSHSRHFGHSATLPDALESKASNGIVPHLPHLEHADGRDLDGGAVDLRLRLDRAGRTPRLRETQPRPGKIASHSALAGRIANISTRVTRSFTGVASDGPPLACASHSQFTGTPSKHFPWTSQIWGNSPCPHWSPQLFPAQLGSAPPAASAAISVPESMPP